MSFFQKHPESTNPPFIAILLQIIIIILAIFWLIYHCYCTQRIHDMLYTNETPTIFAPIHVTAGTQTNTDLNVISVLIVGDSTIQVAPVSLTRKIMKPASM